ncbi:MAG: sigma-70 family RNA polymerase sigma factor [Verrucomicrobiota bacterium]
MPTGVTDSFHKIVDDFYQGLYRFALSLSKNEHQACDLTQQTFAIYAEKHDTLRDISKVKSWLYTTLYREFLRQNRRNQRSEVRDPEVIENTVSNPEAPDTDHLDEKRVLAALDRLEETFRMPLVMFYLRNHSYAEISEILDIPIGTVMSRLSRGKARLKKIFLEETDLEIE